MQLGLCADQIIYCFALFLKHILTSNVSYTAALVKRRHCTLKLQVQ